jgi:hypothetical protein
MKVFAWVNSNLDGACSALAIKHVLQCNIDIQEVNSYNFSGLLKGWLVENFHVYDKVFIIGLMIPAEVVPLIDSDKVVIIDNYEARTEFKNAKIIADNSHSCIDIILKKFKPSTTAAQKLLYNMVGDYCSNTLAMPDSIKLNAVYSSYNKPKVQRFIDRYNNGFDEFNISEKNAIKLYLNKLREVLTNSTFFTGLIKDNKIVSCFADYAINEVANYAMKKTGAELSIVVNLEAKTVFLKRGKNSNININILAEKICNGSGREDIAVGTITNTFLSFSKTLCQCT